MKKTSLLLLMLTVPVCHSNSESALNKCNEKVIPIAPLELVWPGLPAGGVTENNISETVTLKFTVNNHGQPMDIEVINSTSRVYDRAAKRTIAKTIFISPLQECVKYMKVKYED
ncbi:energy transducer TonB [Alteromonas sp. 009811495]|uniref:energy transducer TonB n=1 Tax=Alteromonas sp. 009811495 TaxID=3002962 RepID=UPI00237D6FFA|nr:energy transducer TonB [Alteromonas sp. 009811495]WDT86643.1 energy transducer TonB [Alteromonas sp. 009811495]